MHICEFLTSFRMIVTRVGLAADQRGATAIEYGLIAALISLACVIAFLSLGINLSDLFFGISNTLEGR